jgi:hypothetical protein
MGENRQDSEQISETQASADRDARSRSGDVSAPPVDQVVQSPETHTMVERLKNYQHSFTSVQSLVGPALGAGTSQS